MKLAAPFIRLPIRFDVARLREEAMALPDAAWARHPNDIPGNQSIRLISVDGGENDAVDGAMLATTHLDNSPYLRQVLASFGVVWSRSRLLKLSPYAGVPQHADINHHWFTRARVHIPIKTHPDVRFYCGDASVHMAAGEAWIFDNWRLHRVENPVNAERIHLVADTSGSASFWRFAEQREASTGVPTLAYNPAEAARPLTERTSLRPVMPPAEVDLLVLDLLGELAAQGAPARDLGAYRALLDAFRRDWRQLYQLFGEQDAGLAEYVRLRDSVRHASKEQSGSLTMRTNRIAAHMVFEARVLRACLPGKPVPQAHADQQNPLSTVHRPTALQRPVFIVAAPRSGSTLLFETLAAGDHVATLGGEAPWLIETIPELCAGAPGVDSNRLTAQHVTASVSARVTDMILQHLADNRGRRVAPEESLRFLEKTPKNALRIPFFDALFPDALFVFLWRDPHDNLSSIMEAWKSGNWKTYNGLDGFDGPWSLLLPPGWRSLSGKTLGEIAAFQWRSANDCILDDLQVLPATRWISLSYADLQADPASSMRRLCEFAGIPFDTSLSLRTAAPLPLSRYTQTPPAAGKWRLNEDAILQVMPSVSATWRRLQDLPQRAQAPKR